MSTDLHIIYTETGEGYGWAIESPQIPELVGGRNTIRELINDTPSIIQFAKNPGQNFDEVFIHEQHHVTDPFGDEYLIRWLQSDDDTYPDRYLTAGHLHAAVLEGLYDEEEKSRQPQLSTTERLLLAVVPTDTFGWILDQFRPGDCAVLCHNVGEGAIWSVPIGEGGLNGQLRWGFERLGIDRNSTFEDMLNAVMANEVKGVRIITEPRSAPIGRAIGTSTT